MRVTLLAAVWIALVTGLASFEAPLEAAPAPKKKAAAKTPPKTAPKTTAKKAAPKKAPVRRAVVRRPAIPYPLVDREEALKWVLECMEPQQETFDNARALVPFFEQLYQAEKSKAPIHVLHYGDSHTASDDWANTMREAFQARFGNGGPGFALPGRPWRGYRRYDVASNSTDGWVAEGVLWRRGDGAHGLGGVSLTAHRPGESVTFEASGDESELLFLQQPQGGSLEVWIDDNLVGTVSTAGETRPATLPLAETPGSHRYLLRTLSPEPVRIFGTVVQNKQGVTWEMLGINGAYANLLSEWDESILLTHVAKRKPALIVLAYGTNEANGNQWNAAEYAAGLRNVITRLRRAAPAASILMVGPPDCRIRSEANLTAIAEIQARLAHELNCVFWHWRDRMGGPGSVRYWVAAGLAQYDHIHLTQPGYQLVGRTLFQELMLQYQRFLSARLEAEQ
jgi:lysophospholipase L1-like esterase